MLVLSAREQERRGKASGMECDFQSPASMFFECLVVAAARRETEPQQRREGKRERVMELYTQPNANGLHYRSLSLSLCVSN